MNKRVASIKNYQVLNFTAAWEGLWIKDVKCFPSQFCQVSAGTKAAENCLCSKKKKKRTGQLHLIHNCMVAVGTGAPMVILRICEIWYSFIEALPHHGAASHKCSSAVPCRKIQMSLLHFILASSTEEELDFSNNFWNTFFRTCKFLELLVLSDALQISKMSEVTKP